MAGVVGEPPLPVQGARQRVEHVVERVAEAGDLVVPLGRDVETQRGRAGGDIGRPAAVGLHRPQGSAGQEVTHDRGQDQGGEAGGDELGDQLAQCFVVLVLVEGEHEDSAGGPKAGAGRVQGKGVEAEGFVVGIDEHSAGVAEDRTLSGIPEVSLVERGRGAESTVVAEDAPVGVEHLQAVDGGEVDIVLRECSGCRDVRRDGGRGPVQADVEVAVQGVLHPPVHERRGTGEEHEHGGHEPGDESSPEGDPRDPPLDPAHGCLEGVGRAGSRR